MSTITTERLRGTATARPSGRTAELRTVWTSPRRGGWVPVAIALLLAIVAATPLLWRPQPIAEPAGRAGRVEVAAERSAAIWSVKVGQAAGFAERGPASPRRIAIAPSSVSTSAAEWEVKAGFGRAAATAARAGGSAR
jgi:hypothetical protein